MTDTNINTNDLIGLPCEFDGFLWTIAEINRGWLTLKSADGETRKARIGQIDLLEDAEDSAKSRKMVEQLRKYRERYVVTIASSGKKSLSNGDEVAQALEGISWQQAAEYAEHYCGLEPHSLFTKYASLRNDGMRRMNAGNRLRALYKRAIALLEREQAGEEFTPTDKEELALAWYEHVKNTTEGGE